jgi:hypothetical protein
MQAWLTYGFYAILNIPESAVLYSTKNLRFTLRAKKFLRSFAENNLRQNLPSHMITPSKYRYEQ